MLIRHRKLLSHLAGLNLDIRQTNNGRWYDQKVTPDVMSCICDAIVNYQNETDNLPFTIQSLGRSDFFIEYMTRDFGKPSPRNPAATREYDKFVGQPLNVLVSAKIIKCAGTQPKRFEVNARFSDVLNKMAGSEQESVEFLNAYITKVLYQSSLSDIFEYFFQHQNKYSFFQLKNSYCDFIHQHTPISGNYEPRRIFSKVLNIQAFLRRTKGASRGRLSRSPITLNDIRYNRINFLDVKTKKPKNIPRQQYHARRVPTLVRCSAPTRLVRLVINAVKNHHESKPEVEDQYSPVDCRSIYQVEGHHIFPKSSHPEFSTLRENIILLTQTQHAGQAHGGPGKTVLPSYQHLCLQKKIDAIKTCDADPNCTFYSFKLFKEMLRVVGIISDKAQVQRFSFDDVLREMARYYSAV